MGSEASQLLAACLLPAALPLLLPDALCLLAPPLPPACLLSDACLLLPELRGSMIDDFGLEFQIRSDCSLVALHDRALLGRVALKRWLTGACSFPWFLVASYRA
jgi:hypothetical protein